MSKPQPPEVLPPHNLDAEASVLGSVLLDNSVYPELQDLLTAEHFYSDANRHVYEVLTEFLQTGQPADMVTVAERLKAKGLLDAVGGPSTLAVLTSQTPTSVNAKQYAAIVRDHAARRALITLAHSTQEAAQDAENVSDTLSQTSEQLANLCRAYVHSDFVSAQVLARTAADELTQRVDRGVHYMGLSSGYTDLDAYISGLGSGHLVIVAGLTGMGKTSFLLDLVHRICLEQGTGCAFFSLEMSVGEIMHRLCSKVSRLPCWKIQQAEFAQGELAQALNAFGRIGEGRLFLDSTAALTLAQLQAKLRRIVVKEQIRLVVVDYIQLVSNKHKNSSRQEELASIAQGLKQTARELNITVVCGGQLNSEAAEHDRPKLEHIRESRVIAHEADTVLFLNRKAYGKPEASEDPTTELLVAKARHGRTGLVRLEFDARTVSFVEKIR